MRKTPATLLTVFALLYACDYDPRGRCTSARDCLAGQVCASGVCAAPSAAPVDQAPVAADDAYAVASDAILTVPAASGVLANDADPDGDPLTVERVAVPAHGIAFLSPDGSFTYVPASGYTGEDSFTYRANDGVLPSTVATVVVTVGP